ncbi:MAG: hypothetical protein GIW99_09725 [Candidatus Eremiobacteraeota bacterium]|nr:hypothetical protein [Candidatus Eremiobacteraeota bacterium]
MTITSRNPWPRPDPHLIGTPVIGARFPFGLGQHCSYDPFPPQPWPQAVEAVSVTTQSGTRDYVSLSEASLAWLSSLGAIEFHTWSPRPSDPYHAGFGRILLRQCGSSDIATLRPACRATRTILQEHGIDAILMFNGIDGADLWLPFSNAPAYPDVLGWLHAIAAEAADRHPDMLSKRPERQCGDRIHINVVTNAVGHWSIMPYSLRGVASFAVALPVLWDDLNTMQNGDVTAANIADRLASAGDVFAQEKARIGPQSLPDAPRLTVSEEPPAP